MTGLAISGSAGPLARRLVAALSERSDLDRLVLLPRRSTHGRDLSDRAEVIGPFVESERLVGIDTVVHLTLATSRRAPTQAVRDLDRALLRTALAGPDTARAVVVSSATVYGAWANNPVPITEQGLVRPNGAFEFGVHVAEMERVARRFRLDRKLPVAVLRPATPVSVDQRNWLADRLIAASAVESSDHDPPWQFLHLDDLASAVLLAADVGYDGVVNVAPDGWISGSERRALLAGHARIRVPDETVEVARALRQRVRPVPDGLVPYVTHPWAVANGRLKELGWSPRWTNDEALVVAERAPAWATLNARQRQHLSLGALGAGAGVAAGLAGWVVRRQLTRGSAAGLRGRS